MLIFLLDPQLKSIFTNTEDRSYKYAQNIMTVRSDHCRLIDQEEKNKSAEGFVGVFLPGRAYICVCVASGSACKNVQKQGRP